MLAIASGLPPLLLSVTVCAALALPTDCVPKLTLLADRLTVGGVATPVPDSATVCGLPAALSVMVTDATRLPAAVGLNVTLIVQLAPPATLAPHVFVCEKSPAFVPAIAMLVIDNGPPVLLSVIPCATLELPTDWLPKLKLLTERLTEGGAFEPVPDSPTECGLPGALSAIVTAPVRFPAALGVKVTLIVQFAPAATLDPQVLLCAKSPDATI